MSSSTVLLLQLANSSQYYGASPACFQSFARRECFALAHVFFPLEVLIGCLFFRYATESKSDSPKIADNYKSSTHIEGSRFILTVSDENVSTPWLMEPHQNSEDKGAGSSA